MAIDWTQEQAIPSTFTGGYQWFTPTVSGFVLASVGPGGDGQAQVGLVFVGDSVVNLWATGGSYLYADGSASSWLPGNAILPVAANGAFLLGAFNYTPASQPPTFNFWWVPASAASTLLGERDQAARREAAIARAERTKPALPAAPVGAAAS